MSKVQVKNIREYPVFDIDKIKKKYGNHAKDFPTDMIPRIMEFDILEANNTIANSIRKVILSENKCAAMKVVSLLTNDPFVIENMIVDRIAAIPVNQKVPLGTKLTLDLINTSPVVRKVTTNDIDHKLKKPFHTNIHLFDLNPNKFIKLDIEVVSEYTSENANHTLAHRVSSTVLDEKPLNITTGEGVSSSMSTAKAFHIKFETNGTMDPSEMVVKACNEIITRLENIREMVYMIAKGEVDTLVVPKENYTTGYLITRAVTDIYPDISFVSCFVNTINTELKITLRSDNSPNVLNVAIKKSIDDMKKIKSYF